MFPMVERLLAILGGRHIATIVRNGMVLDFAYEANWADDDAAHPLSLSLPLHGPVPASEKIENFLWNLLPDNPMILERWGQRFHVSPRNVFALLCHVGEDCAGAVQYLTQKRAQAVLGTSKDVQLQRLSEHDVAVRLHELQRDASASRRSSDRGQFSLAGAQPKLALYFDGLSWAIPYGRAATTHIIKPAISGFDSHEWNEHVCLQLAKSVGLPAARSEVRRFENEAAIVVERYDRFIDGDKRVVRIHQEDFCQALGVHPQQKYENQGGPSATLISMHIAMHSSAPDEDQRTFFDALIFNYLIAGTDAHAKNYALLFARGPQIRLAPLYDVASWLPYKHTNERGVKLAMKIGGEYRTSHIAERHWTRLAYECSRTDLDLAARCAEMRVRIITAGSKMRDTLPEQAQRAIDRILRSITR